MEMRERNKEHRTHKRTHTRPLEDPSSFLPKGCPGRRRRTVSRTHQADLFILGSLCREADLQV